MTNKNNYPIDYPGWADETHRVEQVIDTSHALRAIPKEVRRRVVVEGRQRYVAFDCHALFEEGELGRPGHLW